MVNQIIFVYGRAVPVPVADPVVELLPGVVLPVEFDGRVEVPVRGVVDDGVVDPLG